jgi:hypothetical protein
MLEYFSPFGGSFLFAIPQSISTILPIPSGDGVFLPHSEPPQAGSARNHETRAARTPPESDYRINDSSAYKFSMSFNTFCGF